MRVSMVKFGQSVKLGRRGQEITSVNTQAPEFKNWTITVKGGMLEFKESGSKELIMVSVTNIAYMIIDEDSIEATTSTETVSRRPGRKTSQT